MLYSLIYMSNLKNQAISLHNSTETVIDRETNRWLPEGKQVGWERRETGEGD